MDVAEQIEASEKVQLLRLIQSILREHLIPYSLDGGSIIFSDPEQNIQLRIKNAKLTLLSSCLDFDSIYYIDSLDEKVITTGIELLHCIKRFIGNLAEDTVWDRLFNEVGNDKENIELAKGAYQKHQQTIINGLANSKTDNLVDWVDHNTNIPSSNLYIEQLPTKGNHHPICKAKVGLSHEEVIEYSPEFNSVVKIRVAAIHKSIAHVSLSSLIDTSFRDWFSEQFPQIYSQWKLGLEKQRLVVSDYLPMPTHPWQEQHIIKSRFSEYIAKRLICFIEDCYIKTSPTLSFRTVKPLYDPKAPYIKLSVAVQAGSITRTLSPAYVKRTPIISDVLGEIFARENNFNYCLKFLPECVGICFNDKDYEGEAHHLGAIFRKSVDGLVTNDESAILVASLFELSPISNAPLFVEQMSLFGVDGLSAVFSYFKSYAKKSISAFLGLYLRYGIALEGHQQNTFAVFRSGELQYFIIRDFDGIDIDRNVYEKHFRPDVLLNRIMADEPDIPRNNLLHSFFQCHLGELIILLSELFNCAEEKFWEVVADVVEETFMKLRYELEPGRWEREYKAISEDDWVYRSLFKMRLVESNTRGGIYTKQVNPLLQCKEMMV